MMFKQKLIFVPELIFVTCCKYTNVIVTILRTKHNEILTLFPVDLGIS
jgi:hypothetical protein